MAENLWDILDSVPTAGTAQPKEPYGLWGILDSVSLDPGSEGAYRAPVDYLKADKVGVVDSVGRGLAHGVLGLGETVGTATQWLGNRVGIDAVKDVGKTTSGYWGKQAESYKPSAELEGKNVWDNPEILANASWWAYNVADMVPALAASIIPGGVAGNAIRVGAGALKWTPQVIEKAARIGSMIAGGAAGGALEGAQTYKSVLEKGGTEEEAARSGELMTLGAGVLNAIGVDKILTKAGTTFKGKILNRLGAGVWEGITEGAEEPTEVFSKYVGKYLAGEQLPDDLNAQLVESLKEAITVAPVAALTGFGGASVTPAQKKVEPPPPPNPVKDLVTEAIAAGPGPDRAAVVEKLIPFLMPGPAQPQAEVPQPFVSQPEPLSVGTYRRAISDLTQQPEEDVTTPTEYFVSGLKQPAPITTPISPMDRLRGVLTNRDARIREEAANGLQAEAQTEVTGKEESDKVIPFKERPTEEKQKIESYNKKMDSEEWVNAYEDDTDMQHFTKEEGHSPLADELLKDLERDGLKKGANILEIGSGQGRDGAYLAKNHIVNGIDVSDKAVAIANERAQKEGRNASFQVGDAEHLVQFEDESKDAVYSIAAIHGTSIPFTFKEIHRVLKPGGQAKLFLYTRTKTGNKWISYWTPGEIKQYAKSAGFKIEKFREGHDTDSIDVPGVSGKVEQETHLVITTLRKPKQPPTAPITPAPTQGAAKGGEVAIRGQETPQIGKPWQKPNVVFREVRDYKDNHLLGYVTEPYDGTKEGAAAAAPRLTRKADQLGDWSNIQSRIGATDENGRPKFTVSPNFKIISDVKTEEDEARNTWGEIPEKKTVEGGEVAAEGKREAGVKPIRFEAGKKLSKEYENRGKTPTPEAAKGIEITAYHGSPEGEINGDMVYFTDKPDVAEIMAESPTTGKQGKIAKARIRIDNPYYAEGSQFIENAGYHPELTEPLKAKGHDGIIFHNKETGHTEYLVFSNKQISPVQGAAPQEAFTPEEIEATTNQKAIASTKRLLENELRVSGEGPVTKALRKSLVVLEKNAKPLSGEPAQGAAPQGEVAATATGDTFTVAMSPMARGKAQKALDTSVMNQGKPISRKALVERKISEGATVQIAKSGERRLTNPDESYLAESQISKTAMDYAEHLIKQKDQPAPLSQAQGKEGEKRASEQVQTIAGKMDLDEFERKGYAPEQVTKEDWTNLQRANLRKLGQKEGGDSPNAPWAEYEEYHKQAVKEALSKGDEIDPEVLKDYPDLSPKPALQPKPGGEEKGDTSFKKDTELYDVGSVNERLQSVYRQIQKAIDTNPRSNTPDAFDKQNEKIRKLNDRRDLLVRRIKDIEAGKIVAPEIKEKAAKPTPEERRIESEQKNAREYDLSPAKEFVETLLGDSVNQYNKTALARFLDGTDKKYNGLMSSKWTSSLEKLGISESLKGGDVSTQDVALFIKGKYEQGTPETLKARGERVTEETKAKFAEEEASTESISEREARRKTEPQAPHGWVYFRGSARPFTEWREVTRGKQKGKVEVTIAGMRRIVPKEAVRSWPEAVKAEPVAEKVEVKEISRSEALRNLEAIRQRKPHSIEKRFGANGPTVEQKAAYDAEVKDWNRQYREAKKAFTEADSTEKGKTDTSLEIAPTFYSMMSRVLSQKLPGSNPADKMLQAVQTWAKKGEFKADELKWSGLEEWLSGKTGRVTKQEVLDFLKANQVEIREVTKGEFLTRAEKAEVFDIINKYDPIEGTEIKRAETAGRLNYDEAVNNFIVNYYDQRDKIPGYDRLNELHDRIYDADSKAQTKFSQWQLPGGENYQEIIFVQPSLVNDGFRSTHFPEIAGYNGHMRVNDRVGPNGEKILLGEEFQNDRHQKGRKEGYKQEVSEKRKAEITSRLTEIQKVKKPETRDGGAYKALDVEERMLQQELSGEGVPPAPFAKTWHEFMLKRMLRYAAENGYDQLAWTTGEQQAFRYKEALLKEVDEIAISKNKDGTYHTTFAKDGNEVLNEKKATGERLNDLLGKAAGDVIKSADEGGGKVVNIPAKNLHIGGEGMKGFYDKIIPEYLNKYIKRWNAKVSYINISTGKSGSNVAGSILIPTKGIGDFPESLPLAQKSDSGINIVLGSGLLKPGSVQGSNADPNTFSSLLRWHSSSDKTFGKLPVPVQTIMMGRVSAMLHDPKIGKSVIRLVPIDMVNRLVGQQLSSEELLHNPAILSDHLTLNDDGLVSSPAKNVMDFIVSDPAFPVTEALLGSGDVMRWPSYLRPTASTKDFHGTPPKEIADRITAFLKSQEVGEKVWSVPITPSMKESVLTQGQPMFSVAQGTPTGLSTRLVNRILDPVRANLPGAPELIVVEDYASLPQTVKDGWLVQSLDETTRGRIKGVHQIENDGKVSVYMVADNFQDTRDVLKTAIHEIVGHAGIRAAMSTDKAFGTFLNQLYESKKNDPLMKWILEKYSKEEMDAETGETTVIPAFDTTTTMGRQKAADEWFARTVAEKGYRDVGLRRIWHQFVRVFREWMRKAHIRLVLSDAEIADVMNRAWRQMEGKGKETRTPPNRLRLSSEGDEYGQPLHFSEERIKDLSRYEEHPEERRIREALQGAFETPLPKGIINVVPSNSRERFNPRPRMGGDLIIEAQGTSKEWKEALSKRYEGLKGRRLSDAIKADGYDSVVTMNDGNPSETVILSPEKASPREPGGQTILSAITSLQPTGQARALVPIPKLRDKMGMDPKAFDDALIAAVQSGEVAIHPHDSPFSLSEAERNKLLSVPDPLNKKDKGRTYYVGVVPKAKADVALEISDDPRANAEADKAGNPFGGGSFAGNVDKARETLRPFFNNFMYWIVDKNHPIQSVQSKLGTMTKKLDLFLSETQRPKITAAKVKAAWDDKIKPIIQKLADSKIDMADFEEYDHAKHAHEANTALRPANAKRYVDAIMDAVPTKESAEFRENLKDDLYPEEFYAKLNEAFDLFGANEDVAKIKERWDVFSEKPSGMTNAEATDILEANKDNAAIEEARKMLLALNNERLDILRDAGVIADEEYEAYKKKYKYYVPLYREGFDDKTRGTGKGITPAGRAVKTRMGSTRNVVNIFANSVSNYENAINRAEKAASARTLLALVKANPDPDFWGVKEVKKSPKYDSAGNIQLYPNIFEVSPNEIRVMVDGKQYLIEVNRSDMNAMLMLKTLKAVDTMGGPLVNSLSKLNRWLSRINTSWSPEFILSNFVRDIQTAGINVKDTGVESKKMLRGALESIRAIYNVERGARKGTPLEGMYDRFKRAGGKIGWADVHGSIEKLANKITKELDVMSGNRPVYKTLSEWMKWVEDANTSIENGIRLHTFRLAVSQGMTDRKAAQIASDLTVDFTKKGAAGPVINALYLFANAGIQGSYRIMRAGAKSAKVRQIMGGIVGAGFLVGLLNAALGGSDDDDEDYYNKIDDFVRERNMIFMLPGTKGKYVKIPSPWGYNFFYNLGDEISRVFTKKNYKPLDGAGRMASVFAGAFNPLQAGTLLQTLSPTITDPFVQVAENKNWFGGELMPAENKFDKTPSPDSERYWKSVGAPSRWVASQLNYLTGGNKVRSGGIDVSPETLDLILDTAGGSVLRFAKDIIGTPVRLAAKEEVQLQNIPFLRRVAGEKTEFADSRLYRENITGILTAKEELKAYVGTDYYQKLLKELRPEIGLISAAEGYERQLKQLRKARNAFDLRGNKEQVKALDKKMNQMYQSFNKLANSKLRAAAQ